MTGKIKTDKELQKKRFLKKLSDDLTYGTFCYCRDKDLFQEIIKYLKKKFTNEIGIIESYKDWTCVKNGKNKKRIIIINTVGSVVEGSQGKLDEFKIILNEKAEVFENRAILFLVDDIGHSLLKRLSENTTESHLKEVFMENEDSTIPPRTNCLKLKPILDYFHKLEMGIFLQIFLWFIYIMIIGAKYDLQIGYKNYGICFLLILMSILWGKYNQANIVTNVTILILISVVNLLTYAIIPALDKLLYPSLHVIILFFFIGAGLFFMLDKLCRYLEQKEQILIEFKLKITICTALIGSIGLVVAIFKILLTPSSINVLDNYFSVFGTNKVEIIHYMIIILALQLSIISCIHMFVRNANRPDD